MTLYSTEEIPDCVGIALSVAIERLQAAGYTYSTSYTKPPRLKAEGDNQSICYVIRQTSNHNDVMLVAAPKMTKEV